MKIIVIGGGIGGLCSAIALQQLGIDVMIYEKSSSRTALGAGLGIGANALKALEKIGVKEQVLKSSRLLKEMVFLSAQGKRIIEIDSVVMSKRFGTDNVTIHRADLHSVLHDALKENTVKLNKHCIDFEQDESGVTVTFADGTKDRADAIVAADGIQSVFRKRLLPHSSLRYAGYTCWRGVISDHDIPYDNDISTETWGASGRFGIVPLAKNRMYWFACINATARDPKMEAYQINDLLEVFKNYHDPIPHILAKTPNDALIHNDIVDLIPIKKYAFGRVALLGDAAHATTPNLGQGAGQSMEDAYVLASCLKDHTDIEAAFKSYEQKRVPRTTKVIKMSKRVGELAQIENKFLIQLRNTSLRFVPPSIGMKQFEFLYRVDDLNSIGKEKSEIWSNPNGKRF